MSGCFSKTTDQAYCFSVSSREKPCFSVSSTFGDCNNTYYCSTCDDGYRDGYSDAERGIAIFDSNGNASPYEDGYKSASNTEYLECYDKGAKDFKHEDEYTDIYEAPIDDVIDIIPTTEMHGWVESVSYVKEAGFAYVYVVYNGWIPSFGQTGDVTVYPSTQIIRYPLDLYKGSIRKIHEPLDSRWLIINASGTFYAPLLIGGKFLFIKEPRVNNPRFVMEVDPKFIEVNSIVGGADYLAETGTNVYNNELMTSYTELELYEKVDEIQVPAEYQQKYRIGSREVVSNFDYLDNVKCFVSGNDLRTVIDPPLTVTRGCLNPDDENPDEEVLVELYSEFFKTQRVLTADGNSYPSSVIVNNITNRDEIIVTQIFAKYDDWIVHEGGVSNISDYGVAMLHKTVLLIKPLEFHEEVYYNPDVGSTTIEVPITRHSMNITQHIEYDGNYMLIPSYGSHLIDLHNKKVVELSGDSCLTGDGQVITVRAEGESSHVSYGHGTPAFTVQKCSTLF